MSKITYCSVGSYLYCHATDTLLVPMPPEEAERLHREHQPYEAIVGDPARPQFLVTVLSKAVLVSFYDELSRFYMEYQFHEGSSGRLFLTHALVNEYDEDSDDASNMKTFCFHEDGDIYMANHDFKTNIVQERSLKGANVEANWDDFPQFGDYWKLCRSQRD
jgi:hypothetical protein